MSTLIWLGYCDLAHRSRPNIPKNRRKSLTELLHLHNSWSRAHIHGDLMDSRTVLTITSAYNINTHSRLVYQNDDEIYRGLYRLHTNLSLAICAYSKKFMFNNNLNLVPEMHANLISRDVLKITQDISLQSIPSDDLEMVREHLHHAIVSALKVFKLESETRIIGYSCHDSPTQEISISDSGIMLANNVETYAMANYLYKSIREYADNPGSEITLDFDCVSLDIPKVMPSEGMIENFGDSRDIVVLPHVDCTLQHGDSVEIQLSERGGTKYRLTGVSNDDFDKFKRRHNHGDRIAIRAVEYFKSRRSLNRKISRYHLDEILPDDFLDQLAFPYPELNGRRRRSRI